MKCRYCDTQLVHSFLDLGFAPPSNAYLSSDDLSRPEVTFPLRLRVCDQCWLVQTEDFASADQLFRADYAYFSSTSSSWLAHAAQYCTRMLDELSLTPKSHVVEIAANDGYLLKNFVVAGIPCLGVEPTAGTAAVAESLGIPIIQEFFSVELAEQMCKHGQGADLLIGNNVLAHVPNINDFCRGLKQLLNSGGTLTLEFPHLLQLLLQAQFDTVYHEHFSYLSLRTVQQILASVGLLVFHVEFLATHGGSLRIFACHSDEPRAITTAVAECLRQEAVAGLHQLDIYQTFQTRADGIKNALLSFLLAQQQSGKTVVAYGAAAKGNTLLNYAGVRPDLLPYVCDAASSKQGRFLPGSHIPIMSPDVLMANPPDFVLILPWNLADEIGRQLAPLRSAGTRFVVAVPSLEIL
ncbi:MULTISPECIES: methyltransferase C-terminal domain-containing protein [Aeromonas]|uniref:methyltransferase C-terminal domain-containing protein n=1 Tax=Aeromonas TaxID=642 RepID=UPI001117902D|nr:MULTISPECIES: methyltransferase C-terminal domain-containing protein [Aeromonas]TNI00564.1 SAM-dependent methyltransferase [Aeromonas jandaei]USP59825.1 methyltransferase domain-containing protein [Aeromonas veronii]